MPYLDRAGFLELLDKLASESDTDVLAAAREIQRRIEAADVSWADLVRPAADDTTFDQTEDFDVSGDDIGRFEIREQRREPEPALPGLPPVPERLAITHSEELNLINSLLRRANLSKETRDDLISIRADIATDAFAEMDRTYLRDLASRLNARDQED